MGSIIAGSPRGFGQTNAQQTLSYTKNKNRASTERAEAA
jgi:hypothetical protein